MNHSAARPGYWARPDVIDREIGGMPLTAPAGDYCCLSVWWDWPPIWPAIRARAPILVGAEACHAARLLGGKFPIIHSWLIPLGHRLAGKKTIHLELTPLGLEGAETSP